MSHTPLYTTARNVVQKISKKGFIAYFAGGCVRDRILKHPSDDIDIATDATVEDIISMFDKTIPVGINFGIVIVVENGFQFEVATFRKEEGYKDGRRPDKIERATPKEDAQRRDFTINGMFFDPITEKIYDYVKGQEDLKKKIIRAIGDPHERFLEDRLRMIRAVRYAARFHFTIEEKTVDAIKVHAQDLFPSVAIERVVQEFQKMALFTNFTGSLVTLHKYGLLQQIFPLLATITTPEIEERLKHVPAFPKKAPLIAKLLELFDTIPDSICEDLKLSNEDKKFIEELKLWNHTDNLDDYELVQLYSKPNAEVCLLIKKLHHESEEYLSFHKQKMRALAKAITRTKNGQRIVTAAHLKALGIEPGKEMGKLLLKAERIAINQSLDDPDKILPLLRP